MTSTAAADIRAWSNRLMELAAPEHQDEPEPSINPRDVMSTEKLQGNIVAKQLADVLGLKDVAMFNRAINKVRNGRADKLSRQEMTELAIAWVNLMDLDVKQTNQAMNMLRRVHAPKETPSV
jgi:hypothetical protein